MLHAQGNDLCLECHRTPEIASTKPPVKEAGEEAETEKGRKKKRGKKKAESEETIETDKEEQEEVPKEVALFGRRVVDSAVFKGYPKILLRGGLGHPVSRHPITGDADPRNPERAFGCKSCHDPHGSRRPKLLIGGSGMGLCGQCHKK
jgi:predicted CXXCH cytochrome family protein